MSWDVIYFFLACPLNSNNLLKIHATKSSLNFDIFDCPETFLDLIFAANLD